MPNQYSESYLHRAQAKQNGDKTYQGTPCRNCGSTIKSTSHSGCVKCHNERNAHKLYDGTMNKYKTRPIINAKTYRYRTRKLGQMPPSANSILIREFYSEAERKTLETGIIHHVDHKIPLSAGGLHHQDNLQVITAKENWLKGGKCV